MSYRYSRHSMFKGPTSGLIAEGYGRRNPRNLPCPTCRQPNKLTPADKARGYQCDECANLEEGCY